MKHFTKSLLVLFAALFSFSLAFAETGTETEANQKNGNKNTTAEGQSYTIDGTYIAGTGSSSVSPMTSKGLKFRTAQNGAKLEFTVRENYTITKLYMAAIGNYFAVDNSHPYVTVSKVEVDGTEVTFVGGEFPEKGASAAGELTVDNIEAKEKIVLYFDNSNTNSGETQLNASWSIDWSRPDATQPTITVTPKSLALVPGASSKLSAHIDPASFVTQWASSDEAVATVDAEGIVTAVAPGTANILHQWADDATVAGACAVTVAEFDPSAYTVTSYDFTTMGDVELTVNETAAGAIWNEGNNKPNNVFFCTNTGLENIAVQAVLSGGKGWSIVDGEGLVLASGAGRCAAVGNLLAGQVVEILYTGNSFYTGSKNDAVRKDDGASKTALNEGIGRAIYKMDEAGLLGFELERGKAVTQINVYSSPVIEDKAKLQEAIAKATALNAYANDADLADAIANAQTALAGQDLMAIAGAAKALDTAANTAAKNTLQTAVAMAKTFGVTAESVTAAEALLANSDATTEQLGAALEAVCNDAVPAAKTAVSEAKSFFNTFDKDAAADLADEFAALETALEGTDINAIKDAAQALYAQATPAAKTAIGKVKGYLEVMNNETITKDLADLQDAMDNNDFPAIIAAAKQAKNDLTTAVPAFLTEVNALIEAGTADGKNGVDALETAYNAAQTAITTYLAAGDNGSIVPVGEAIYNLVKAVEAYEQANAPVAEDPELTAPEGWTNAITNGNLAGDDVSSYVVKDATQAQGPAVITPGVGKDGSRGIVVKSKDEEASADAWNTQFWIVLNEELPTDTKLHVEFDYKASQAATASTQAHAEPGSYHHWAAIDDVNFTTEWQHFSADVVVSAAMAKGDNGNGNGTGMKSIAFNLAVEKSATEYYFDNFGVWYQEPKEITAWADIIVNGDMEGDDAQCFYVTEQGVGGPFVAPFTEGIGKDGSKAVKVQSADSPTNDWDSQFFIRLPYQLPAGTKYRVSFDYKADKAGNFATQSHANPGQYIHWAAVGDGSFTTEWQTYQAEGSIPTECDGSEGDGFLKIFQTIAFNLAINQEATEFIFDNVKFLVDADIVSTLTLNPDANPVPYPSAEPEPEPFVFPSDAIVYDFEAAAAAGENPANKNGSSANGQAFYGWENPEKTDSQRQDYKGYEWAEGSVLPEKCHVWRRSDRINGNVADGGLKCPSNKEMAIDGLVAGNMVIIIYDATAAAEDSKEIVWAIGDGTSDGGPGSVRATATIDGVEAVTGEATIASGAEIIVNSVTPADNGSGYIVFQVKKGMIIKQIGIVPGSTNGIEAVAAGQQANDAIYNLSGQKVMKAGKGLYIINGKKVVK